MLLEAIFSIGTIVLTEFVRTTAIEVIRYWVQSSNKVNSVGQSNHTQYPRKTAKNLTDELEIIDAEVIDLERKQQRDRYTSNKDQERKEELESLRIEKFQDYQKIKKEDIAEEQSKSPENYETSILKSEKVHVLQYHMGQVVLEKKCKVPQCGRPMILNSKQRLDNSLYCLSDFFWSCTGYYNQPPFQCVGKQQFQAADIGFLHKADVFEFQISNQDLSRIFDENSIRQSTVARVKSHLKEKDDEILCSVHHIPMILKEKREHLGVALDMFFLGCPHPGCQQLVKLKSPAQLAAYLSRREGRGIL